MTILVEAESVAIAGRLEPTRLGLAAGELTCLVGPNGSGKTSLLHALARVGRVAGSVRIAGVDPDRVPPSRRVRLLGFLPAGRDIAWPLVARDLIRLGGADPGEVDAEIDRFALAGLADRPVDRLSTGERSRILLARVFAAAPDLLLLDEPTANLDPLWQLRLMARLREDLKGTQRAALVALHDLDAALSFGDRLLVMNGGSLAFDLTPDAFVAGPGLAEIFGIERVAGEWRALSPADRRSSP